MPAAAGTLLSRRGLIVMTGKGGVGKTALTAALGKLLAAAGRRTLLLEIDARHSLHHAFGIPPSEGDVVELAPRLALQTLRPTTVLEEMVRAKLKIPALARRVTNSPIFQHFAAGAPGFKELALLGHALKLVRGDIKPKTDVVVLDAPATGHAAALLTAPQLVADVIPTGPVGALATEVAGFVADEARCTVALVTLAEEIPRQEAVELITVLRSRMGRAPALVAVNRLFPAISARVRSTAEPEAMALWRGRHADNLRELKRLRARWPGPLAELPLLALEGEALIDALAAALEAA